MFPYLEEETEANPLIILDISPLFGINSLIDPRMRHIDPDPLPKGTGNRVSGVDPTVGVQHVLGDVLGVDTVDGVAHVLSGGDDQRKGQQTHDSEGVVQPEDGAVDVNMAHFD